MLYNFGEIYEYLSPDGSHQQTKRKKIYIIKYVSGYIHGIVWNLLDESDKTKLLYLVGKKNMEKCHMSTRLDHVKENLDKLNKGRMSPRIFYDTNVKNLLAYQVRHDCYIAENENYMFNAVKVNR